MWYVWLSIAIASLIALLILSLVAVAAIGLYFKIKCRRCTSEKRLNGKTVLVTGGTAGMGIEVAAELAKRGARVIVACPFQEEGTNAERIIIENTGNKDVEFRLLDLASLSSTRQFADEFLKTEQRLDILVNNAGVVMPNKMTADDLNFVMQVNYYGMFLLTILLLPLLKKSGQAVEPSRIVNVSSISHRRGQVPFNKQYSAGIKVYYDSKLCVTLFVCELTKRLSQAGVTNVVVNAADPGVVATNIANNYSKFMLFLRYTIRAFYPSPKQGAQATLHVALAEEAKVSGGYFMNCELILPGSRARDAVISNKLWEETVKAVCLSDEEIGACFA